MKIEPIDDESLIIKCRVKRLSDINALKIIKNKFKDQYGEDILIIIDYNENSYKKKTDTYLKINLFFNHQMSDECLTETKEIIDKINNSREDFIIH